MKRVVGIGGIFFKGKDHAALREWYAKHLGIATGADGASSFEWRDAEHPDETPKATASSSGNRRRP
jgi:hypothetical protein